MKGFLLFVLMMWGWLSIGQGVRYIKILDSVSQKPLVGCNVSIYWPGSTDFLQDIITDTNGIVLVPEPILRMAKVSVTKDKYPPTVKNIIAFDKDTFTLKMVPISAYLYARYIRVIDRSNNKPITFADVSFYNVVNKDFIFVGSCMTDSNGFAKVPDAFCPDSGSMGKINANDSRLMDNKIPVSRKHWPYYWPAVENVRGSQVNGHAVIMDVMLIHPVRIENVYFAYNRYDLIDFYKEKADSVVSVLKQNPDYTIELQGHTDNKGSEEYNLHLSALRANEVKKYMVYRGINKDRIIIKAMGKSQPLVPNEKDGQDDPEGRARNRRVVFSIIPPKDDGSPEIEYEPKK